MTTDTEIADALRRYLDWWTRGTLDELGQLYDEIADAGRSDFPWQIAIEVLSKAEKRRLFRAFDDEELQDLYDWASEVGLGDAAARFAQAVLARPSLDDGVVPPEIKQLVMTRDGLRCQLCGATTDLTIDHKLIPWIEGGSSKDPANLHVLCRSCNSRKGTRPWPLENQE